MMRDLLVRKSPSPQPSPTGGEGAIFFNALNLTPSPLVGEGWGEGSYTLRNLNTGKNQ